MCACFGGYLDVVQYLLKKGANVDAKDNVSGDIIKFYNSY
jgi:ankyrin repeat protein